MSEENIKKLLDDKDQALEKVEALYQRVMESHPALNEKACEKFAEHFEFMRLYVKAFRLTCRTYSFTRYMEENGKGAQLFARKVDDLLTQSVKDIHEFTEELPSYSFMTKYPYDQQLDPERFESFLRSIKPITG